MPAREGQGQLISKSSFLVFLAFVSFMAFDPSTPVREYLVARGWKEGEVALEQTVLWLATNDVRVVLDMVGLGRIIKIPGAQMLTPVTLVFLQKAVEVAQASCSCMWLFSVLHMLPGAYASPSAAGDEAK